MDGVYPDIVPLLFVKPRVYQIECCASLGWFIDQFFIRPNETSYNTYRKNYDLKTYIQAGRPMSHSLKYKTF